MERSQIQQITDKGNRPGSRSKNNLKKSYPPEKIYFQFISKKA